MGWEVRVALLEGELVMTRFVDIALFEESSRDGISLKHQSDGAFSCPVGATSLVFHRRFLDDVMYGPISAAEMRDCMHVQARRDREESGSIQHAGLEDDLDALEGRGTGSEVFYSTVYPVGDELAVIVSAADFGLESVIPGRYLEWYPMSRRLRVLDSDMNFIDLRTLP